jgi:hypothetical protein
MGLETLYYTAVPASLMKTTVFLLDVLQESVMKTPHVFQSQISDYKFVGSSSGLKFYCTYEQIINSKR